MRCLLDGEVDNAGTDEEPDIHIIDPQRLHRTEGHCELPNIAIESRGIEIGFVENMESVFDSGGQPGEITVASVVGEAMFVAAPMRKWTKFNCLSQSSLLSRISTLMQFLVAQVAGRAADFFLRRQTA